MIDNAIANLKNYVDNENIKLYNYVESYTDSQISISQNYLISLINDKFSYLINYINSQDNLVRYELQLKINELNKKIDEISFDGFEVIDPTSRSIE